MSVVSAFVSDTENMALIWRGFLSMCIYSLDLCLHAAKFVLQFSGVKKTPVPFLGKHCSAL